jgi:putative PIN family toxin of toxin-antitoxin system
MGKKIVLDTNVIISAFGWQGAPHEIFKKCISGHLNLILSPPLLSELKRVLAYPKFNFNQDEIDEFLAIIIETVEIVEPELTINLIPQDSSDNRVLECAVTADCEFIISGDKHLLEIKEFGDIKILAPDNFLKLL